jgi:hypothetical protein
VKLHVFIAQEGKEQRLMAVRCPCCGGRILDAAYGTEVMVSTDEPTEPPDYIIKCWRCKHLLGVKETEANRTHEQTDEDGLAEVVPTYGKPMNDAVEMIDG